MFPQQDYHLKVMMISTREFLPSAYSIPGHWKQPSTVANEKKDKDLATHNWQSTQAKDLRLRSSWEICRRRQAWCYNNNAHNLHPLSEGDTVRINPFILAQHKRKKGVTEQLDGSSYKVCRNRRKFLFQTKQAHLKQKKHLISKPP